MILTTVHVQFLRHSICEFMCFFSQILSHDQLYVVCVANLLIDSFLLTFGDQHTCRTRVVPTGRVYVLHQSLSNLTDLSISCCNSSPCWLKMFTQRYSELMEKIRLPFRMNQLTSKYCERRTMQTGEERGFMQLINIQFIYLHIALHRDSSSESQCIAFKRQDTTTLWSLLDLFLR